VSHSFRVGPIAARGRARLLALYVDIRRPPDEVFTYLAELHDAEWRSGVAAVELLSDTPHRLGARHVEVRRVAGRHIRTTTETSIYHPPRRIAFRRATGPVRPEVIYSLTPIAAGTRLTPGFRITLHGTARLLRPLAAAAERGLTRAAVRECTRLRNHLERQTPP
jgi:hypothetical protein